MLKIVLSVILPFTFFFSGNSTDLITAADKQAADKSTGTLQKMIVANGSVSMKVDLNKLNRGSKAKGSSQSELRFAASEGSFFKIIVFNNELRGPIPSSMDIIPHNSADLPSKLSASYQNLVVEYLPWGGSYEMAIRDGKTGFTFFNIEGLDTAFDHDTNTFSILSGRLLISPEFATELGRPGDAGIVVGDLAANATMRTIEITEIINGDVKSSVLPPTNDPEAGTVPGPDVVVGDIPQLQQPSGGQVGTQVGLAIATDSCNFGTVPLNWFAMPQVDHPVIPQNLYRMSGGASNNERFEQISQSNLKHAFFALQNNICGLGCVSSPSTALGTGCSDPYSVGNNSSYSGLGSRAWVNPFTGAYPSTANNHTGHTHTGPAHRMLTEVADLIPAQNPGATYYAEGQYVTPHEYAWCQANPTQCNMYNNASYRQFSVSNSASPFSFAPVGSTVRQKSAINAWIGSTAVEVKPAPGTDGVAFVAYKVTNPSAGVWHYEYAVYNQNLDRAIQLFSVPVGGGATLSNIGFHAPPQHPGWANDGTFNSSGFSSAAWAQSQANSAMTWNSETLAENQNANAIRWGTLYNFRFDSTVSSTLVNTTIGFFKTGAPIVVQIQGPGVPLSISGTVTFGGRGVTNATVTLRDPLGVDRVVRTNRFGYYQFTNLPPGGNHTITVTSRRHTFTSQQVTLTGNLTNTNFVAN